MKCFDEYWYSLCDERERETGIGPSVHQTYQFNVKVINQVQG